jgi:hypothetical protein
MDNNKTSSMLKSRLSERIQKMNRLDRRAKGKCAKYTKKVYKVISPLKYVAILTLLIVPFLHRPHWCLEKFGQYQFSDDPNEQKLFEWCGFNTDFRETPTENDGNVGIPRSNIPMISTFTEMCITVPCYALIMFFVFTRTCLKRPTVTGTARTVVLTLLLLGLITS